jgi:hypothetical protein
VPQERERENEEIRGNPLLLIILNVKVRRAGKGQKSKGAQMTLVRDIIFKSPDLLSPLRKVSGAFFGLPVVIAQRSLLQLNAL